MKGCWLIRQLVQQLPDSLRAWYVWEQWKLVSRHAATRVSVWHVLEDFSPSLVQFVVVPWSTCTEYIFLSVLGLAWPSFWEQMVWSQRKSIEVT